MPPPPSLCVSFPQYHLILLPAHALSNASSSKPRMSLDHGVVKTTARFRPTAVPVPARDRVIDFGRHKGKMLGTLPSTYLKWVSTNLRARDFQEWAQLADEVLNDPVYRDRIEWEFAHKVLSGDNTVSNSTHTHSKSENSAVVSQLLEISERFGWDNDDKAAWRRIDFGFLGTSKGGRIPRLSSNSKSKNEGFKVQEVQRQKSDKARIVAADLQRRSQRRERVRMKKRLGVEPTEGLGFTVTGGGIGKHNNPVNKESEDDNMGEIPSPFPGRQSLLKEVLNSRPRIQRLL